MSFFPLPYYVIKQPKQYEKKREISAQKVTCAKRQRRRWMGMNRDRSQPCCSCLVVFQRFESLAKKNDNKFEQIRSSRGRVRSHHVLVRSLSLPMGLSSASLCITIVTTDDVWCMGIAPASGDSLQAYHLRHAAAGAAPASSVSLCVSIRWKKGFYSLLESNFADNFKKVLWNA